MFGDSVRRIALESNCASINFHSEMQMKLMRKWTRNTVNSGLHCSFTLAFLSTASSLVDICVCVPSEVKTAQSLVKDHVMSRLRRCPTMSWEKSRRIRMRSEKGKRCVSERWLTISALNSGLASQNGPGSLCVVRQSKARGRTEFSKRQYTQNSSSQRDSWVESHSDARTSHRDGSTGCCSPLLVEGRSTRRGGKTERMLALRS